MPNKRISEFPVDTNPIGSDALPIVNEGITKQISLSAVTAYISGFTSVFPATQDQVDAGSGGDVYVTPETFQNAELWSTKVDVIAGKGLSTNDFSDLEKSKLDALPELFSSNITVNLSNNKTFGKYISGSVIPSSGLTAIQVISLAAFEYINPIFTSFNVNIAQTVEVGTTLSGNTLFTWGITINSGSITNPSIYDDTAFNTIATVPNTGSATVPINIITLTSAATQSWHMYSNDTNPSGNGIFSSNNYTVSSAYKVFYGDISHIPSSSSDIRGLANSRLSNAGNTFTMATGTQNKTFIIALPPTKNLISVFDLSASNFDLTQFFILQTTFGSNPTNVHDAAGNNVLYKIYVYSNSLPYNPSHNLSITIA